MTGTAKEHPYELMSSKIRKLKEHLTCQSCLVSKLIKENFRRSGKSKTGHEYRCKQCREVARIQVELAKWQRLVDLFRGIYKGRERRAGSYLLGAGVAVQKEHRFPTQVIYTLVDPRTEEVRYVGRTGNPERRFLKHLYGSTNELKCEWIDELRALGLRPLMVIVENVEAPNRKAIERERRWIFHLTRQKAQLTNHELITHPRLVRAIQASTVDFLTEPLRSRVWLPIYHAECEDSYMLFKFKMVSSYRWAELSSKEMIKLIAEEIAQGSYDG